jgi:hypothetical protein
MLVDAKQVFVALIPGETNDQFPELREGVLKVRENASTDQYALRNVGWGP